MTLPAPDTPHEPIILDGRQLALEIRERLAAELTRLGSPPVTLATVLIGEDPASRLYVGRKQKEAQAAGMLARNVGLPATASQAQVEAAVADLAADPEVHGILVQLPLPDGLEAEPVLDLLPPDKDVDGLTQASLGRLVRGQPGHVPCTPKGVVRLLERYEIPTVGRGAVIVGRSTLVGLPLCLLLSRRGIDATVTVAHSKTPNLAELTRKADILIAATGSPGLITAEHVKPGAAVIDVGVSRTPAGIRGDVAFEDVRQVAGAITPMPGGTGPMTVACLLENTLAAARMQAGFPPNPWE